MVGLSLLPAQPSPRELTGVQSRCSQRGCPQQEQPLGQLWRTEFHPSHPVPSSGADWKNLQFGVFGETAVEELAGRGEQEEASTPAPLVSPEMFALPVPDSSSDQGCV